MHLYSCLFKTAVGIKRGSVIEKMGGLRKKDTKKRKENTETYPIRLDTHGDLSGSEEKLMRERCKDGAT